MSRPTAAASRLIKHAAQRKRIATAGPSLLRYTTHTSDSRPSDFINLLEKPPLPRAPQISATRLKDNEYASMYAVSEEELLNEEEVETAERPLALGSHRVMFEPDGLMVHRIHKPASATVSGDSEPRHKEILDVRGPISNARLRDNCRCSACVDPSTRQKLRTSGSAAGVTRIKAYEGYDAAGSKGVHVHWSDSHVSFYSGDHLKEMVTFNTGLENLGLFMRRKFWDRKTLEGSPNLRMAYDDVQTPEGLLRMLKQAQVYGLVIISGVPTERTSDRDCELRAFMGRIGEIRNTFYGQTWDVKSVQNSKNVAYTAQDLGLHMDLLYFSTPPRWQALHCLKNRAEGGSSYFADAFWAGLHIQQTDPVTTDALAKYPIDFEYDNDGHYLRCRHFVLNSLDSLRSHVNWSPPFQAQTPKLAGRNKNRRQTLAAEMEMYSALAKFEAAIAREGVQYEFTMQEGDLVFFDNRRVLHARRAFHGGDRWLKGCYLDAEVVWDKLVTMQR